MAHRLLYRTPARLLAAAGVTAGAGAADPSGGDARRARWLQPPPADAGDVGISAGFVHGVGFVPQWWGWRWLLGPLPAWLFCALGYAVLAHARLG